MATEEYTEIEIELTEEEAKILERWAEERGVTVEKIIEEIIEKQLDRQWLLLVI